MRKCLMLGTVCALSLCSVTCTGGSAHPKTPTAVVEALFEKMTQIKSATAESSTEDAARGLQQSKTDLDALFLNPEKGKLITMPLAMLDLKDAEFLEENIHGQTAEVVVAFTVAGFGQQTRLQESAQTGRRVTFQLTKESGRWKISDIGGILGKYGR